LANETIVRKDGDTPASIRIDRDQRNVRRKNQAGWKFAVSGDDVTVHGVEVDGNFQLDAGSHSDGSCTALSISGDQLNNKSG